MCFSLFIMLLSFQIHGFVWWRGFSLNCVYVREFAESLGCLVQSMWCLSFKCYVDKWCYLWKNQYISCNWTDLVMPVLVFGVIVGFLPFSCASFAFLFLQELWFTFVSLYYELLPSLVCILMMLPYFWSMTRPIWRKLTWEIICCCSGLHYFQVSDASYLVILYWSFFLLDFSHILVLYEYYNVFFVIFRVQFLFMGNSCKYLDFSSAFFLGKSTMHVCPLLSFVTTLFLFCLMIP